MYKLIHVDEGENEYAHYSEHLRVSAIDPNTGKSFP